MTVAALLRSVVAALDAAGVPFMLTGSLAAAYHGAGRATMDIDVVIDPTESQLRVLVRSLERSGLYVSSDAADEALWIASAEDVIVAKLEWARLGGSARQIEDVAALLRIQAGSLDRAYIEHWVGNLGLTAQWDQATRGEPG
jgi:hypothetical protein